MRQVFQILHHRSLTISVLGAFFAVLATVFMPESWYRWQHLGMKYLMPAGIIALLGLTDCAVTFVCLLRDDKSGYPSFRLSVATLLWAVACVPILFLSLVLIGFVLQ
jgi:hypothetical protein